MTPAARRALEIRKTLAKSSVSKLETLETRVGPDDRLRYELRYYGAHTGRWAGSGVQVQNFPRGGLKPDVYDAAVAAIDAGEPIDRFGNPLDVLSSTLRASFAAPPGYQFVVADLSQVEVRVLAWLSGCPRLTAVFAEGRDPYIDFAARLDAKPLDAVTKDERQTAKPAVLAAGFGQGPGKEKVDKNGDRYFTGLRGYAARMNIHLTEMQAADMVYSYRSIYHHVTILWNDLEAALLNAVAYGTTTTVGKITIGCIPEKVVWMLLPSGRRIHYLRPRVEGDGRKQEVTVHGYDKGNNPIRERLWFGDLVNNGVQGIARDLMVEGMLAADEAGFTLLATVHDEVVAIEKIGDSEHTEERLHAIMTRVPEWGEGLMLGADTWAGPRYKKG